jgi:protein required for attachment to host cells
MEIEGVSRDFRNVEDMARSIDLPKSAEILADKPGRTFDSVGTGRHAKESPTDPRRHLKRQFARTVIEQVRQAMLARRFDRLILIAAPAFLGDLRQALPQDLKDKVAGEVASDLTNVPQRDLSAQLRRILARG